MDAKATTTAVSLVGKGVDKRHHRCPVAGIEFRHDLAGTVAGGQKAGIRITRRRQGSPVDELRDERTRCRLGVLPHFRGDQRSLRLPTGGRDRAHRRQRQQVSIEAGDQGKIGRVINVVIAEADVALDLEPLSGFAGGEDPGIGICHERRDLDV